MLILDYYRAIQQIAFSHEKIRQNVLSALQHALEDYQQVYTEGQRGDFRRFFFALHALEGLALGGEERLAIAEMNRLVLGTMLKNLFLHYGIEAGAVQLVLSPYGLEVQKHRDSAEIMAVLENFPALLERTISAIEDTAVSTGEGYSICFSAAETAAEAEHTQYIAVMPTLFSLQCSAFSA